MMTLDVLLKQYFGACCAELFHDYGVELRARPGRALGRASERVCGVIGFTGQHIKGSLVLATTLPVVRASYPAGKDAPSTDLLVDWAGELANQLLGRIKNRLLHHRVELLMSTPVGLTGAKLARAQPSMPRKNHIVLRASSGAVEVCFEAETDGAIEILEQPMGAEAGVANEGDIVFF